MTVQMSAALTLQLAPQGQIQPSVRRVAPQTGPCALPESLNFNDSKLVICLTIRTNLLASLLL